jgi:hypothetical protein
MARLFVLALFLMTPIVLAQNQSIPITGRVLNKDDGTPIAGATVRYRGDGNVSDGNGHLAAPPALQGQVTTGPDGTYTTPALPAFGDFTIHATAPGFFSAKDYLQALPASLHSGPPPLFDRDHRDPEAPAHDGLLRLRPDPVDLQPMSDAALAAFRMPLTVMANRSYLTAAFAADGSHLGFITFDTLAVVGKSITRSCRLWSYNLQTGALTGADLPGSPYVTDMKAPDTIPGFCTANDTTWLGPGFYLSGYAIAWDGSNLYAVRLKPDDKAPNAPPAIESFVLRQSTLTPLAPPDRPASIQALIVEKSRVRKLAPDSADAVPTTDGRFIVKENFDDDTGRGSCSKLEAVAKNPQSTRTITQDCPGFTWRIDPDRDLVFYTQPNRARYPNSVEDIVEFDLKTALARTFSVPSMNFEPELLTEQAQPNGSVRVAYTMRGDCDFAASDYSQPGQPDGVLGNTPNQSSVCFMTIPANRTP